VTAAVGTSFAEKYRAAAERNGSLLCVGLDPDPARLPVGHTVSGFLRAIVEATADLVCCYKPNSAFFEALGTDGYAVLREVIEGVPTGIPVLLDAKRGDVGHTAAAYARAAFDVLGADAITVNPYLGGDAVEPFLAYEDRHVFVLCRTSNAGAADVQDFAAGEGGEPLYLRVARLANGWNARGNVGLVVGATYPEEAARIREVSPELLFLMPGVGAQDADLRSAVRAAIDASSGGILVNASRSVLYADASPAGFADAARAETVRLRDAINAARNA
jgi:orotidine-5'-phosphate decarboxylase